MSSAYEDAKTGGPHASFLRDYSDLPYHLVEKAIRSLTRRMEQHQTKIADPYSILSREAGPARVRNLVEKKWPKDIQRQTTGNSTLPSIYRHAQAALLCRVGLQAFVGLPAALSKRTHAERD